MTVCNIINKKGCVKMIITCYTFGNIPIVPDDELRNNNGNIEVKIDNKWYKAGYVNVWPEFCNKPSIKALNTHPYEIKLELNF